MMQDMDLSRYSRQMRFAPLGEEGQRRLAAARAVVCGCGALGGMIANTLVRAGVGLVRIVDRDFVEISNLQRQVLFEEADAANGVPKAVAAAEKLRRVNSTVTVEPVVADLDGSNIESLCDGMDVMVDGTDNFETRFLINDVSVKHSRPWVYGGCVGAEGQVMTILPGKTPCLRCLMPECPAPGSTPTCDTMGVLGPIVSVIGAMEALEAIKILSGHREAVASCLTVIDLWRNTLRQMNVQSLREQVDCPTCNRGTFDWLHGRLASRTAVLCGRNAVQLSHPGAAISLDLLAEKLENVGEVVRTPFMVRLKVEGFVLTIFPDARTIVAGTSDIAEARAVYAKYVGT